MTQVALRQAEGSSAVGLSSPPQRRLDIPLLVECSVGAVLAATLLAYMALGNFTRYVQDDFSATLDVRAYGFWREQILAYRQYDGHFLGTALQDAGGMLNPIFVRVLPGALIASWVALLVLALRHLVPAAGRLGRLLIAAGIVYTTLRVTPNPFLAVYWMTASLAYVGPLLLATVLVWLVARPGGSGWRRATIIAASGLVAFLAAGLAEEYTAAQTAALTLAVAVAVLGLSSAWRLRLPVLAAAWVGSVLGLGLMAASPGNAIRSAAIARLVGPRPSLLSLPGFTFPELLHFFHALLGAHWHGLLAVAILAALVGARSGLVPYFAVRSGSIVVALATVGAGVVVFAAMTPAALEQAQPPHDYAEIVLVYICVCSIGTLGWMGGRLGRALADRAWLRTGLTARNQRAIGAVVALLVGAAVVIGPIATLASMRHDLPAIRAYAQTKDAQAAAALAAHAAGRTSVVVPPVTMLDGLGIFSHVSDGELHSDPHFWVNQNEAEYYGIATIATSQPPSP